MRAKIFLVIAALVMTASLLNAQTNNFTVADSKAIWQKVYETELSYEDIFNLILNNGSFTDVIDNDGKITCRILSEVINFKSLGFKRSELPIYALASTFTSFCTIQVKDGRYRATVENIILTENTSGGILEKGTENPIETWAVKNGAMTKMFSGVPSRFYDTYLTNKFTLQGKSYMNDEW